MAEPPKNGVGMVVFFSEVDFSAPVMIEGDKVRVWEKSTLFSKNCNPKKFFKLRAVHKLRRQARGRGFQMYMELHKLM